MAMKVTEKLISHLRYCLLNFEKKHVLEGQFDSGKKSATSR